MATTEQLRQASAIIKKAYDEVSDLLGLEKINPDIRRYRNDAGIRFMAQDMKPKVTLSSRPALPPVVQQTDAEIPAFLALGMQQFGIRNVINSKGDRLIDYKPSRPKYPFVFESVRGSRWKISGEQARSRFG